MGQHSDDLMFSQINRQEYYSRIENRINAYIWTTKTSVEIPVKEMTKDHIVNSIKMLNDKLIFSNENEVRLRWVGILTNELATRC